MRLQAYIQSMKVTPTSPKLPKIATRGSTSVAQRKFNFTRQRIEGLPNPTSGQRAYYYDTKVRGLAVAVSAMGKKSFLLYRKVSRRPERITIGPFMDISIEQARTRAEQLNADIARGENPAANKRRIRDEATLKELFNVYLENHAKPFKRTWADDEAMFNFHLASWHVRKISSIRKVDVVTLHGKIGRNNGPYMANRVVDLLCTMFNRAKEWGWQGENPAAGVKAFPEQKRERFMDGDELRRFFQGIGQELNTTIRDYILVSLFTGARRRNVQSMRWTEINWSRATWTIPAAKAKSGETVNIALSPVALRLLESRKADSTSEWVFPGRGKSGHLEEPKTAWRRILKRAELVDLRLHDLRRTLGSWQAATGASLPIIGKSLGHKSLTATQIYARLDLDPVRASVNKATDAMLQAGVATALLGDGATK
jgi:integrase